MHSATPDANLLISRTTGVVVPIRAFTDGMARLSSVLSPNERADLGRNLAGRVIRAASNFTTVVVTSAPEVIEWCEEWGLSLINDPGSLNASAEAGREWCRTAGLERVIIAHADLPRVTRQAFAEVDRCGESEEQRHRCVIVACHRNDGTPALGVPTDAEFKFSYGPGSFQLHLKEARNSGLGIQILNIPELSYDIDLPEDLSALDSPGPRVSNQDDSETSP